MSRAIGEVDRLLRADGPEKIGEIRAELRDTMMDKCGVFRTEEQLGEALAEVKGYQERYERASIDDHGQTFNTDLLDAVELGHMLEYAEVIIRGAIARQESRGGHARRDFPKRDDEHWFKHTLAYREPDGPRLEYCAVNMAPQYREAFPLQERTY